MTRHEAPGTKIVSIPKIEESPAVRGGTVSAHEDTAHVNAPIESPGGVPKIGILFGLALFIAIGYGIYVRRAEEGKLQEVTRAASVLTVPVIHPMRGSQADDLTLPGTVQAFTDTPIYSRTNGYLKKWYFDIGSHVRAGQLLAVIDTPEVDQQLIQSRA